MNYDKKRRPFFVRFLRFIFGLILTVAIAIGGVWAYFYFAKNVNIFATLGQLNTLCAPVDAATLVDTPITADDKTNAEQKESLASISSELQLLGAEFGALLNNKIAAGGVTINFNNQTVDLRDWNFEMLEVSFFDTSATGRHMTNLKLVLKFDTVELKKGMTSFPLSLIQGKIPDTFYITSVVAINKDNSVEGKVYDLEPLELSLNALDSNGTKELFRFLNVFSNAISYDKLITDIASPFVGFLLGGPSGNGLLQVWGDLVETGYELNWKFDQVAGQGAFCVSVEPAVYEVRVYQQLGENIGVNVATITGAGEIYDHNSTATLTVTPSTGYVFVGWWRAGVLVGSETTFAIEHMTSDVVLTAKFEYVTKSITYENTQGAANPNPTTFNVTNQTILLQDIVRNGYNFLGWFTELSGGTQLTAIECTPFENKTVFARWSAVTYTISYNLGGGTVSGTNPTTYNIESGPLAIINPTKPHTEFLGWTASILPDLTLSATIPTGTYGHLVFTAHYQSETEVFLYIDGQLQGSFSANYGETITPQIINERSNIEALNSVAYTLENWYTNVAMTTPYTPSAIIDNLYLYGTLEYFTDQITFYPYLTEFNNAVQHNSHMTFDSQAKLLGWIDYTLFYRIPLTSGASPTFNLTYISGSNEDKQAEVRNVFETVYPASTGYQSTSYGIVYSCQAFGINEDAPSNVPITEMATLTADPTHTQTQTQFDNALAQKITPNRASNFDDFKINLVQKTLTVSNSEQLVHALEQGYRPLCTPASRAEQIYNAAKTVLRQICTNQMSNVEKLRAIYEWIILNVQYDHKAATTILDPSLSRKYRAWFAEGVFLDKMAVCEGISKAVLIMSRIENIPAIIVSNHNHAWNKVVVDGQWYTLDATHGNLSLSGSEVTTYAKFLFPDSYRPDYVGTEYPAQTATNVYNYFQNVEFNDGANTFDLVIETTNELNQLFTYVKNNIPSNITASRFTVEFVSTIGSGQFSGVANAVGLNYESYAHQTIANGQTAYLVVFSK